MTTETMDPEPLPALEQHDQAAVPALLNAKDIERSLAKVQKDLADYHAAENLTPLQLAQDECKVGEEIMALARHNMEHTVYDPKNRLTSFSENEALLMVTGCTFAPMVIGGLLTLLLGSGLPFAFSILFALGGFIASMELGERGTHPYLPFRNKVLLRKQYKREIRRITAENVSTAERNQKLLAARKKKLERAEARVRQIAVHYEQAHPGKTLTLSEDKRSIVEGYKDPLRDLGSTKELATALANSPALTAAPQPSIEKDA